MAPLRKVADVVAWGFVITGIVASSIYALGHPLNHDVGLSLHLARAMLGGEALYTTLIEVNPPLYAYLAMIPAELASALGVSPVGFMQGSLLLLCLAMLLWVGLLTARCGAPSRLWGPLLVLALAVPILVLAGVDFGQREHLMVVLTAPYLVLVARRRLGTAPGRLPAALAGLAAGVGFALKPHFLVVWLTLEIVLLVRAESRIRSWFRPEALTLQAFFVAYAGFVMLVHPEYLEWLWRAGPLYADYWAVDRLRLLFRNRYFVLLVVTAVAFFLMRPTRGLGAFVAAFLIPAAAAYVMAVVQGKGWLYHFYPTLAWTVATAILLVADFIVTTYRDASRATAVRTVTVVLVIAIGALSAGSLVKLHGALGEARSEYVAEQSRFLEANGVRSLLILSPSLATTFPLVNHADLEWTSPFASLWWVSALHADDPRNVAPVVKDSLEAEFLDILVSSLVASPPEIVLIDTAGIGRSGGEPFPYVAYLSQHPGFETLWARYRDLGRHGRFKLYSRVPVPTRDEDRP